MATKKPTEKKPTKFSEVGVTGLMQYSGYVTEERLRQLEGDRAVKVYREMADNDDTIGAILFAIEGLLRRVDWRVEAATDSPDDRDLADFVESCTEDMSHSFEEFISEVLSMLVYGWASHEIVYKVRVGPNESDPRRRSRFTDGLIGWRKLPIRSQDSLDRWEFDEDGGIRGWWQWPPTSGESMWLPIEKLLHFRTTSRKNNPQGRSILRNAYRPWFYKKEIERIEAVGVERDLAGLPVMYVPPAVLDEGNSEYDAVRKRYQQIVENVRRDEQSGLLLPAEYDEQNNQTVRFELLSTGGTRTFDTNQVINRYAKSIATTVLADVVLLGHEKVGSFALADSKTKLFATGMAGWLKQIEAVLNRFAIPRLLRVNGFNPSEPPRFVAGDLEKEDVEQFTSAIERVTMAGWITPGSVEDENHVRDLLSLPQVDDSGFDARDPMDIDTEDRPEAMQDGDRKDQEAALNGAQVTAMVQVVSDVANGLLPRDSGVQIIANSFPISFEEAERIVGEAGRGFIPRTPGTENDLPPDP